MINLLRFLLKPEYYNKYRKSLPTQNEPATRTLLKYLDKVHEEFKERVLTYAEFTTYVLGTLPDISKKDKDEKTIIEVCLERGRQAEISEDVAVSILTSLLQRARAFDLATVALEYSEGRKTEEQLQVSISDFGTTDIVTKDIEFVTDDLDELYDGAVKSPGLSFRLQCLRESLGPLRKGDFGFIFARPESGKTTFISSEVSFMSEQLKEDDKILWINNEEEHKKVKLRIYESLFGLPLSELQKDRKRYYREFCERGGSRILMPTSSTFTRQDVEVLVKTINPKLIVVDQIDKIEGFDSDRDDIRLGRLYQWMRDLAKEYCPIIAVCQADGSGEGVKFLNMGHVALAKTAKQAEADWILGIGKSHDHSLEYVRHLNISKNKLIGDEHTNPENRHAQYDVLIQPQIARYCDI